MNRATIVEMDDGRIALLLVEIEPEPGPVVLDPTGEDSALADPDDLEERG